ncbi:aspartate dehydrogenase [Bacillus aerolatus]|uniref:L-aspartate dehydrogenase n=1 Tax=Bacillus aerolatus TaxID=2653354 RepID=A0A6I1FI99_9BACI|nr:aspartate dehydrogenase [Bacillus aerolatus]KAB7705619.1 aspartate dehydrogenase [Bacillus aerolatus]
MLRAGLIGYGTIGKNIAELIRSKQAGNIELKTILVRNAEKAASAALPNCTITADEELFFNQELDIVIEAAGHHAVELYGEKAFSVGSNLLILSIGALADQDLHESLQIAADNAGKQLFIPSAAIAGLDRIASGVVGEMEEITLITRKPTKSWYGTIAEEKVDLTAITEPYCIYEGSAREAAKLFPESVNASATLSLAGIGFEKTKVQVYIDPTIDRNVHTILAKGCFGEVEIAVKNTPSKQNPKSSPIVAMSVAKVLKNLTAPVVVGL